MHFFLSSLFLSSLKLGDTKVYSLNPRSDCEMTCVDQQLTVSSQPSRPASAWLERYFFIDNLLVRVHFVIEMIRWTGLVPWEFEFSFSGSLASTFLGGRARSLGPASA